MTAHESSTLALTISQAVRRQYERHPYPHYPLWLPIQWQEAYASTALFTAQLLRENHIAPAIDQADQPRILIAGCGEMFPAVLSRWEPRQHQLLGVDLSMRHLRRARIRSALALRPIKLEQGDLADSHLLSAASFAHVDAYGVLHHMADPRRALENLHQALQEGGSLRLMVYNSQARSWIHHLQRAFQLLALDPFDSADIKATRYLLELLSEHVPALASRLEPMQASLKFNSRLVDTFLHAREARLDLRWWMQSLDKAGFRILGLFDRYAELDDLPNPLYHPPTIEQLEERTQDLRYENNLEIYAVKLSRQLPARDDLSPLATPWSLRRRPPPASWRSYHETQSLRWRQNWLLWQNFLQAIYRREKVTSINSLVSQVTPEALGRLARIGALWPSQVSDRGLQKLCIRPLCASMDAPDRAEIVAIERVPGLSPMIERILLSKRRSLRYLPRILQRIAAAQ